MLAWMSAWLWMGVAGATEPGTGCTKTSIGKLAATQAPGVLVLGERKGTNPDLARAKKLVKKLVKRGPVTLALQAIPTEHQGILERFSRGEITVEQLPKELEWDVRWAFPFETYAPLLEASSLGVKLVAIGAPYTTPPKDPVIPTPPGYIHILAGPMGEAPMPVELESHFASFVAAMDYRLASNAISSWNGQGFLVIIADRYHVEGGQGVQWQARQLTEVPISAAMLANGGSVCFAGDALLP